MSKEIVKACVKYNDRLYTGFEHGECFDKLNDDNTIIVFEKIEQGFIDNDGNFVDRKQAMIIARESGQLSYETDKQTLISEDLHVDWLHKQEKLISKLQSELDYAKKSIEIFKITNDTLQQENLDLSYNQVDNVYELAKEMSENWERDYQQEILELKERLANCIEPKFIYGQYVWCVYPENEHRKGFVFKMDFVGYTKDKIICCINENEEFDYDMVFATEEEAKARLEVLKK